MKHLLSFVLLTMLYSCEKAELPKPLSGSPAANTVSVTMGSDYGNQLFFELASASVVAQNNREIWDLGFEGGDNGRMVVLNSSKFMAVSKTDETALANVNSSTAVDWIYDNQKGKSDSLALTDWELNRVYIIYRGLSTAGTQLGKVKFRITAHSSGSYAIEWGSLNAVTFFSNTIQKSNTHNCTFFSFSGSGQTVSVEPEKNSWDLCFTSYTYIYPDGMPYLVTGVLSNRNLVGTFETEVSYNEVNYAYAASLTYSSDLDIIGYDWKFYDFDLSTYIVQFDKVYVIKSVTGRYYKLRFLDFYDPGGSKGTPSFELQELVL